MKFKEKTELSGFSNTNNNQTVSEVPIFEGKNIVEYRRMK